MHFASNSAIGTGFTMELVLMRTRHPLEPETLGQPVHPRLAADMDLEIAVA